MNFPQKRNRIVWLVRFLTLIGLAMVVTTTGLVGWTLAGMRRERAEVAAEEKRLDRASHQLREYAGLSQTEIAARLAEPLGTVKTRMRSGILRLRGMLGTQAA